MSNLHEHARSANVSERYQHSRSSGGESRDKDKVYNAGATHDDLAGANGVIHANRSEKVTECSARSNCWRWAAKTSILFAFGCAYSFVLNIAQAAGESTRFRPGDAWLSGMLRATWWISPLCGCAAVTLGLLVPALDRRWAVSGRSPEPAHTVRLLLVVLGVHHASTRVPLADAPAVLSIALSVALCSALWYVFDKSPAGLAIASAFYALAHALGRVIDARGLYDLEHVDASNVARWLPTLFFAAAIMLATLGRQLTQSFAPASAQTDQNTADARSTDRTSKQKAE